MKSHKLACSLTLSLGVLATANAHAAEADQSAAAANAAGGSAVSDDIVVTARRREERIQDVPVAVTAISNRQLENRSVRSIEDIGRIAPSTTIGANARGAQTATVNIRGLENTGGALTNDPAVGIYYDEIYLGRTAGNILASVYDMASVQVLRGPQGTLFGRNNTGGAILFTPNRPDASEIGGEVFGIFGSYSRADYGGIINVPIVRDKLAIRGSWRWTRQAPWGRSITTGIGYSNRHNDGGRVAVRWQPSDDATFDFTYDRTKVNEVGPLLVNEGAANKVAGQGYYETRAGTLTPKSTATVEGYTFRGEFRLKPDMTLKALVGRRLLETDLNNDADGTPSFNVDANQFAAQRQWTAELQLSGKMLQDAASWLKEINYTVGGFYFTETGYDGSSVPVPLPPSGRAGAASYRNTTATNESSAGYAQIETNHFDKLFLTVGARYTHDNRDAQLQGLASGVCNLTAFGANRATVPAASCIIVGNNKYNRWSFALGARYQLSPDANIYIKWDKSYRAGGLQGLPTQFVAYNPESVRSLEAGLKASMLDGRLSTNLAVFRTTIDGMQRSLVGPVPGSPAPAAQVINAGVGRVNGVELEASVRPVQGLTIDGAVSYMDAKYLKFVDPLTGNLLTGIHFTYTPRWSLNTGLTYTAAVEGVGRLTVRGDYSYRTRIYYDALNTPGFFQDGYSLVNARAQLDLDSLPFGKGVSVAVFGRNLTKSQYVVFGSGSAGAIGGAVVLRGEPRMFGVELKFKY